MFSGNGFLFTKILILVKTFPVTHRNHNHRNSTIPTANMVNSTKQVNKVKPNVNRNANENLVSPGYNSR